MTTASNPVAHSFTISEEERVELVRLLEQSLRESRIEIHRTHTPDFRERVMSEQAVLRSLLEKFGHVRA